MAKKNYLNELHSIENMLGKVRSLNEAMSFDSEYDEMDPEMMGQDEVQDMSAEDEADAVSRNIMKRKAEPSEIADAVAFLSSDMSRFITGQVLRVDGGLLK